ncbi:hypothetical protein PT974_12151 [Cladobotryum mycophilum]|uniref:Uncharacterized protein n=1 Tax=Cladobotryum mycophilum TaxID=491253 RepID=A0ABR0S782_9HYPO
MKFLAVSTFIVAAAAAPVQNAVNLPKIDASVTGTIDVDTLPVVSDLPVNNLPTNNLPVVGGLPVVGDALKNTKISARNNMGFPAVDLDINAPIVGSIDVDTEKIADQVFGHGIVGHPVGPVQTPPDVVIDDPKGGFPIPGLPKLPTIGLPSLPIPTGLPTPTVRPKLPPGVSVLPIGTGLPKLPTIDLPNLPLPTGLPTPTLPTVGIPTLPIATALAVPTVGPKLPPGVTILPIGTGLPRFTTLEAPALPLPTGVVPSIPKVLPRDGPLGLNIGSASPVTLNAPLVSVGNNGELVHVKLENEKLDPLLVDPIELEDAEIAI